MSKVYYNENCRTAAAWLRQLIAEGLIAEGDVDERSITDVSPTELAGYVQCHFFAGIGGWSAALRQAGWPDDRPVWTGSCPCQPFSVAGKGLGTEDRRHLWPVFRELIRACHPPVIFGEQVASAAGRQWLAGVFADLEALAYQRAGADLCAPGVGAPHIRQRLYWLAYSRSAGAGRHLGDVLGATAQSHCQGCPDGSHLAGAPESYCAVKRLAQPQCAGPSSQQAQRQSRAPETGDAAPPGGMCGLAHPDGGNGQRAGTQFAEHGFFAEGGGGAGPAGGSEQPQDCGLAHAQCAQRGPEQSADEQHGGDARWHQAPGGAGACGAAGGGLADPAGRQCEQRPRAQGDALQRPAERHAAGGLADHQHAGQQGGLRGGADPQWQDQQRHAGCDGAAGFWDDALWHACRDGKIRRISPEPALFPLAHGVPGRVGLLRGAGNAIVVPLAATFIQACHEAITF